MHLPYQSDSESSRSLPSSLLAATLIADDSLGVCTPSTVAMPTVAIGDVAGERDAVLLAAGAGVPFRNQLMCSSALSPQHKLLRVRTAGERARRVVSS